MITDRTREDVEEAKKIQLEKVQKFVPLSEAEIQTMERGFVTLNTLNRIENKQKELQQLLYDMGYVGIGITNRNWQSASFFKDTDLNRIVNNTIQMRENFFVYPDTPPNPKAAFHYQEFNNIEKILIDVETMIPDVVQYYRECDTFYCGEEYND